MINFVISASFGHCQLCSEEKDTEGGRRLVTTIVSQSCFEKGRGCFLPPFLSVRERVTQSILCDVEELQNQCQRDGHKQPQKEENPSSIKQQRKEPNPLPKQSNKRKDNKELNNVNRCRGISSLGRQ